MEREDLGGKGKNSVLRVAPADLAEFMVTQYFIKIKSRGLRLLYSICALMTSSRVKN